MVSCRILCSHHLHVCLMGRLPSQGPLHWNHYRRLKSHLRRLQLPVHIILSCFCPWFARRCSWNHQGISYLFLECNLLIERYFLLLYSQDKLYLSNFSFFLNLLLCMASTCLPTSGSWHTLASHSQLLSSLSIAAIIARARFWRRCSLSTS